MPSAQLNISRKGVISWLPSSRDASAGPTTIRQMSRTAGVSSALSRLQGGAESSGSESLARRDISRRSLASRAHG